MFQAGAYSDGGGVYRYIYTLPKSGQVNFTTLGGGTKSSWIRIGIQIQEPWTQTVLRIATKILLLLGSRPPVSKAFIKSVHNFLRYFAHRQNAVKTFSSSVR